MHFKQGLKLTKVSKRDEKSWITKHRLKIKKNIICLRETILFYLKKLRLNWIKKTYVGTKLKQRDICGNQIEQKDICED